MMIRIKSEAFFAFKKLKNRVEVERKFKLKMLRTDRGGEFTSKEFTNYCNQEGTKRQLTTPYST